METYTAIACINAVTLDDILSLQHNVVINNNNYPNLADP